MTHYPRASLRIEFGPELRLGPGKTRLLEFIASRGSISAAAREMGMSYRRAWLLIEELNGLFPKPLVETATGGSGGGGASLTILGSEVVRLYREIESDANAMIAAKLP